MKKLIFIESGSISGTKKNILFDGLSNNSNVEISQDIESCNYIFLDFRDFNKTKNYKKSYFNKLIVIDFRDDASTIINIPCLKYFKRSVIDKNTMKFINYKREIIPISYCLKQDSIKFQNIFQYNRCIDISIFFNHIGKSYRNKIANFIKNNFSNYKIFVGICGNMGTIGRNSIQMNYYKKMFNSKIVVTCNPDNWEGDYRTWETLASGSLVFVDNMKTPIINPLIDKKHVIFYNRNNLKELKEKIIYYLLNPELASKISQEGNKYALKYHKPSNRIDEILSQI